MFVELNNLCGISPNNLPQSNCITVEGNSQDSSFIVHHFMSMYTKLNHNVCVLGLAQSFNHYNSVGNKLGVSLSKAREDGKLVFIEGLKILGQKIIERSDTTTQADDKDESDTAPVVDPVSVRQLFCRCLQELGKVQGPDRAAPLLFVVDDVSVLPLLGARALDTVYLLMALRRAVCGSGGCMLTVSGLGPDPGDEGSELVRHHLHHHSQLVLTVSRLQTGQSRDVHGQLLVFCAQTDSGVSPSTTKTMQFKISDKNVSFFALGLSAAVL